jgi:signal transduction histidine kinase
MSGNPAQKILYIEDDLPSRNLVSQVLEQNGYEVLLAADGLTGLQLARAEHPNLILVDLGISRLNGYEVATRLRSFPSLANTPIVALTARVEEGAKERALTAGCDGYIAKPIDVETFATQIAHYLAGHQDQVPEGQQKQYLRAYNHKLVKRLEDSVIELEATNRELKEAHRLLQKLDKMKSDFISLAAHELRTPISQVHGYAYLLMTNEETHSGPSTNEMLQAILNASTQLNKTINDLINVSSVEMGQIELFLTPTSIDYAVHAALNELAPLSQGRNLSIEIIDLNKLPLIRGDVQQLQQVFWNLLSNAVKYTPDNGYVQVWGQEVEDGIEIIVEDTGIGINPADQIHIFGRFNVLEDVLYHSTSDTSFMGGGLGLGLYIVRGIVEAHGGRIWVESKGFDEERCPGSQFHVVLPRNEPAPA